MFSRFPNLRSIWLLGAALAVASLWAAPAVAAGVVGYRNDTSQVVVVQSSITVNGTVRRGKSQMLSPGEVAVDSLLASGPRRITVYDPKKPNSPLFQDTVTTAEDTLLSIQPDAPAVMVKNPPPVPKVKLVPMKLPTPTGPSMPGPKPAGPPIPPKKS